MKDEKAVRKKIAEIEEVLGRRRSPSPERIDIVAGLKDVLKNGKYGTLHKWEEKKRLFEKFDKENHMGKPKNWYQDYWGRKVFGNDMDSLLWQMASYAWALEIEDPSVMKMVQYIKAISKKKKQAN